ncbi:hypothetical protein MBLNU459_g0259t1 [Dothideomycetes sp. NU459]
MDSTQQKRSPESWIQSIDSSNSKDTGHEDMTNLPLDGNSTDSERGQHLLPEPLADISPNLDPSFFAEIGQQGSMQIGCDAFNFSLSPWPFFSTGLPNLQSIPDQPVAVSSSELPTSSSSSSGEEIPYPLLRAGQPQNSSLFGVDPNVTKASFNTSTAKCKCLAMAVFAVEEFETSCNFGNRAQLDSIIAYQKGAIKCCRSMLRCSYCMAKRENAVLLVFMTEKIVAACAQIVALYYTTDGSTWLSSAGSPLLEHLPTHNLSQALIVGEQDLTGCGSSSSASSSSSQMGCTNSSSIVTTNSDTSSDWRELLLGDYEISSALEWENLVRILIFLQMRATTELLIDLEKTGSRFLGETQTASLAQAAKRIRELQRDVNSV